MKPKLFTSILLFISSYSPLFLILAVKDFDFDEIKLRHPIFVAAMLGVTLLSIILLFVSVTKIKKGSKPVIVVSVKNRSVDLINYTIPYVISFFGFDLTKPSDVISLSIFLCVMLILTIKTKTLFINPILAIANYGLYDLEYTFDKKNHSTVIISKYELHPGDEYYIRSLTGFLYFASQKESSND